MASSTPTTTSSYSIDLDEVSRQLEPRRSPVSPLVRQAIFFRDRIEALGGQPSRAVRHRCVRDAGAPDAHAVRQHYLAEAHHWMTELQAWADYAGAHGLRDEPARARLRGMATHMRQQLATAGYAGALESHLRILPRLERRLRALDHAAGAGPHPDSLPAVTAESLMAEYGIEPDRVLRATCWAAYADADGDDVYCPHIDDFVPDIEIPPHEIALLASKYEY